MLKSTAAFVEKRLRKIKFKTVVEDEQAVCAEDIEQVLSKEKMEDLNVEVDTKKSVEENGQLKIEKCENKFDSYSNAETNSVTNSDKLSVNSENSIIEKIIPSSLESSLETKRVSYEDFVTTIDDDDSVPCEKEPLQLIRGGTQKTRWSLRRVFKKKNKYDVA